MTSPSTGRGALIVVAKRPAAGQTKTRLSPPLGADTAASLYECFLHDVLDIMRRVPDVQPAVAYLPADARGFFQTLAPDMRLTPQQGQSLGERLDNLLQSALQEFDRAVVMSSDSPTLPAAYVTEAFARLESADVVLGPCSDGGYYLIGLKRPQPVLLCEVQMSTPHVLTDTLAQAAKLDLTVSLLPEWYDVDTVTDLQRLRSDLRVSSNGLAPHTRRLLADLQW
ncbi:MAG: TIGR04282 family arsenosugar biosynthesis glycosyltransferase [Caldilineales bacterium]|nr:TIGR04282 family arsenosugar biosynthesis glycosyltransferase [Caldilineales bacterium]